MNKQKAALLSIFSNLTLIIFKLIAGMLMSSVSVISEAVHSGIDLIASVIAYFSIKAALKPEDEEHPFGHGKYENISGFVEAILIFFAAIYIIYESVRKLLSGVEIEKLGAGMIVMIISAVVNLIISMSLLKISKKTDSIALEADAMHLLTDVFTSFGVFLGLVLIKITNIKMFDPIIAILVAGLIIKTSIDLTKKSVDDLLDTQLPKEELDKIINIVENHPEVTSYHRLRTRRSGARREIDLHIRVDSNTPLIRAHEISHALQHDIEKEFLNSYIVIHVEPQK